MPKNRSEDSSWYYLNVCKWQVDRDFTRHQRRHHDHILVKIDLDGEIGLACFDCECVWHTGVSNSHDVATEVLIESALSQTDRYYPQERDKIEKVNGINFIQRSDGTQYAECPVCKKYRIMKVRSINNIKAGDRTGLCRSCATTIINKNTGNKLSYEIAQDIRYRWLFCNEKTATLAAEYNVTQQSITKIINNKMYKRKV